MPTTQDQASAMLRRMDAYLHGESAEATAIIKDARELVDVLRAQVGNLMLAEEGAVEAFGVIVQDKRDLEADVTRLKTLLDGAYESVRNYAKRASNLEHVAEQIINDGHMSTEHLALLRSAVEA